MKRTIFLLTIMTLCGAGAAAAGNCSYPQRPNDVNAKQRAEHQKQLIDRASDRLKQYCANAVQAKGGTIEMCLVFRGYMSELCAGTDNGFPVAFDDRFLTPDEVAAISKVTPRVLRAE